MNFFLQLSSNLIHSQVFWIWTFVCLTISVSYLVLIAQLTVDTELSDLHLDHLDD